MNEWRERNDVGVKQCEGRQSCGLYEAPLWDEQKSPYLCL